MRSIDGIGIRITEPGCLTASILTVRLSGYTTVSTSTWKTRPRNTTVDSLTSGLPLIVFRQNQVEDRLQIGGERRFERHSSPICGMSEQESAGMQEWPFEREHRPEVAGHPPSQPAIGRIADDGVADFAQVNAN